MKQKGLYNLPFTGGQCRTEPGVRHFQNYGSGWNRLYRRKKGFRNRISYEKNRTPTGNFSQDDAANMIEINGMNSELVIGISSMNGK